MSFVCMELGGLVLDTGFCWGFWWLQRGRATARAKTRAIDGSLRPSGCTPAFGRVEAAARRVWRDPRLKPWGTQKQRLRQKKNRQKQEQGKSKNKAKARTGKSKGEIQGSLHCA